MFNAVPTARVIFTAKTSLTYSLLIENKFGLFSVLGDRIYVMNYVLKHGCSPVVYRPEIMPKKPEESFSHKLRASWGFTITGIMMVFFFSFFLFRNFYMHTILPVYPVGHIAFQMHRNEIICKIQ